MAEPLAVLLDQNVPRAVADWLRHLRPSWNIHHAVDVGLEGNSDEELFQWAQGRGAIIIAFDEEFADQRLFPVGGHCGVVRLRVWPTTIEETESALARMFEEVSDDELSGSLVIIDRTRIRVRSPRRSDG